MSAIVKQDPALTLKVECKAALNIKLSDLKQIQGDLKSLDEENFKKLRTSLIQFGITFPFFVWQNRGTNWILDGTQRDRVLRVMAEEGYKIPPLPCVLIAAKNRTEACEKILLISSRYGKMTQESLYNFAHENGIELLGLESVLDIPGIDFDTFKAGWLTDEPPKDQDPEQSQGGEQRAPREIECPACGHHFMK